MSDQRIVYGARCSWWDSIDKIGKTAPGPSGHALPCCPHCSGVLFEVQSEAEWWAGVDKYEREKPEPGYRQFVEWMRGKCFPGYVAARAAYDAEERA